MLFLRQTFFILFTLILGGGQIFAAGSREQRAYDSAAAIFQTEMWGRAATALAQFQKNYPKSTNVPMAVLLEAQAEFKQSAFTNTIALLNAPGNLAKAGNLADQYLYWTGEAQFTNQDYSAAAESFESLAQDFTNSPVRLAASVDAAAAFAQLERWADVESVLENTNGAFYAAEQMDPGQELISRGRLFLARARFEQKNFPGVAEILELLKAAPLTPELDWQREHLIYRMDDAGNDQEFALLDTTNLMQIARLQKNPGVTAESFALHARVLEKLNRLGEAASAYSENLKMNAPAAWQRQAVLKIAALALAQNNFSDAETALEIFTRQFSNAPAADIALFSLGELHLKEFAADLSATNHFLSATATFSQFLETFTNDPLAGKVLLDRGWANWLAGKIPESLADFQMAAAQLPPSEDLAIARFKLGDAQFAQKDFSGALASYQSVLDDFADFPPVQNELAGRALYQSLRAELELGDPRATTTLARILNEHSTDELAQSAAILLGENTIEPAAARGVFEDFQKRFPGSQLKSQVDLAVARTFEQEQNWPAAMTNYSAWLENFPADPLRAQAAYSLAWANFQAGAETNALAQFSSFVSQFPASELAPQAQWWVADYFFRATNFTSAGNFIVAETNYENIFQNTNAAWKSSPLVFPAQLMAGCAAMGRLGFSDAVGYFTKLIADSNCPPDLGMQARFICGAAYMEMASPDTNNPLANFQAATNVLSQIIAINATNDLAARAWGEIGKCELQIGDYISATNAFAQVLDTNVTADIATRSEAQIGLGVTLEKIAATQTGTNQTALLKLALDNYANVFFRQNLRADEIKDSFWVHKAGLQMLPLIGLLEPGRRGSFITEMEKTFPQLTASLEQQKSKLGAE